MPYPVKITSMTCECGYEENDLDLTLHEKDIIVCPQCGARFNVPLYEEAKDEGNRYEEKLKHSN